jgi:hypothetical protein
MALIDPPVQKRGQSPNRSLVGDVIHVDRYGDFTTNGTAGTRSKINKNLQ